MNCEQAETLLAAYVFGEVLPPILDQLRGHLDACQTCAAKAREMAAATALLQEACTTAEQHVLSPERLAVLARLNWQRKLDWAAVRDKLKPLLQARVPGRLSRPMLAAAAGFIFLVLIAGMLLPSLGRARDEARKVRSESNLSQIAKGTQMWLLKHGDNEKYPSSLKSLADDGVVNEGRVFLNPAGDTAPKKGEFVTDYESTLDRAGRNIKESEVNGSMPLAWEKKASGRDGRNVVFFNSHVEYVPERRFQELMRQVDDFTGQTAARPAHPTAGKYADMGTPLPLLGDIPVVTKRVDRNGDGQRQAELGQGATQQRKLGWDNIIARNDLRPSREPEAARVKQYGFSDDRSKHPWASEGKGADDDGYKYDRSAGRDLPPPARTPRGPDSPDESSKPAEKPAVTGLAELAQLGYLARRKPGETPGQTVPLKPDVRWRDTLEGGHASKTPAKPEGTPEGERKGGTDESLADAIRTVTDEWKRSGDRASGIVVVTDGSGSVKSEPKPSPVTEAPPKTPPARNEWHEQGKTDLEGDHGRVGGSGKVTLGPTQPGPDKTAEKALPKDREGKEIYSGRTQDTGAGNVPGTEPKERTIPGKDPAFLVLPRGDEKDKDASKLAGEKSKAEQLDKLGKDVLDLTEEEQRGKTPPVRVNRFVLTRDDYLSTFSLTAGTASYRETAASILSRRQLPPAHVVRVEEFVNAMEYELPGATRNAFVIRMTCAASPFRSDLYLLQVSVRAKRAGRDGRRLNNLVLCVDNSGSMSTPDRLPLAQTAARMLVNNLAPQDRVSIVTFGTRAQLALDATAVGGNEDKINGVIDSMQTGGSTNLAQGLGVAYQRAHKNFRSGDNNTVVLLTDAIANVGPADARDILDNVRNDRKNGICLVAAGVGRGQFNDPLLEELARNGDGQYLFIDTEEQAKRVFVDELAALQVVARDAKVQVEFNPDAVRRYRLLGYETRDIRDEDFRNDAVDAGEIGSGQTATALYELELVPCARGALATTRIRYHDVDTDRVEELASRLDTGGVLRAGVAPPPRFRLAACAAQFAELLRGSGYAKDGTLKELESALADACAELPLDNKAAELLNLVRNAHGLPRAAK